MIQLTCTNCKTVLTIDDAFAGGACRCQHCGTIQTVPVPTASSKRPATPGSAGPAVTTVPPKPKALYQGNATNGGSAEDGLQALAQAVASSGLGTGLTGTGLRAAAREQRAASPVPVTPKATERDNKPLIIAAIAIGAVLLAIGGTLAYFAGRSSAAPEGDKPPAGGGPIVQPDVKTPEVVKVAPPTPVAGAANYMNLPLAGPSVIYVLDRGQGTADTFDAIKGAAHQSILSLGSERQFQILFWDREGEVIVTPDSLKPATEQAIEEAKKVMANTFVGGQTKAGPAAIRALAQNPAEVVIVSGKYGLDEEFVKSVLDARKSNSVKIHAVSVGSAGSPEALRQLAEKSGGQFKEITGAADLRAFAGWSPN